MKTKIYITALMVLGICTCVKAQQTGNTSNKNIQKQIDSTGNVNLLDGGANILGDIFGNMGGVEELKGVENYMDLLAKSNLSVEEKKKYKEQYDLIKLSNDPQKEEELKLKITKMLEKAIQEGQQNDN